MNTMPVAIPLDRPGVLSTKTASAVSTGSGSAYSGEHCGIALQANSEKIVTAGWVSNGSNNDLPIVTPVPSGTIWTIGTIFDGGCKPPRAFPPAAAHPRQNIVPIVPTVPPAPSPQVPARHTRPSGIGGASPTLRLDTSFDGDGMLSTTFGSGNTDVAYGVAIQPDGRIIAAGSTTTPGSGGATDFAIARYKLPAGLEQRHFAQHDANFNITSITDANGQVAERYLYTAYGEVTAADGAWYSLSGTQFGMRYFFQGGRYQADAATYNFRNRDYSAELGRWMEEDPLGYPDGANRYQAMGSNPVRFVDPLGLDAGWAGGADPGDHLDFVIDVWAWNEKTNENEKVGVLQVGFYGYGFGRTKHNKQNVVVNGLAKAGAVIANDAGVLDWYYWPNRRKGWNNCGTIWRRFDYGVNRDIPVLQKILPILELDHPSATNAGKTQWDDIIAADVPAEGSVVFPKGYKRYGILPLIGQWCFDFAADMMEDYLALDRGGLRDWQSWTAFPATMFDQFDKWVKDYVDRVK